MKILKFCWWRRKLYWGLHTVLPTVFLNPNITPTDRYRILFPLRIFYWHDPLHAVLFYTVYLPVLYFVSRGTWGLTRCLILRLVENVFSQSASFDFFHVQTLKERCVINSLVYWCVAIPILVSSFLCVLWSTMYENSISLCVLNCEGLLISLWSMFFFFKDLNWWPFIHKWIVVDRCVARIIPSIVDVLWGSSMTDISCTKMGYYHIEICLCYIYRGSGYR